MRDYLIDPPLCHIADQAQAQKIFRRRLKKDVRAHPCLLFYRDSNFRCITWITGSSQKESFLLPAFSSHNDAELFFEEERRIILKDGNFFRCQNDFYMVVKEPGRGLCIKQVTMIPNQELLNIFAAYQQLNDFEFILCKASEINRDHTLVGYVWSGYRLDPESNTGYRTLIPVFPEELHHIYEYDFRDLHYEPLDVGQLICRDNKKYIVKSGQDGIYLDDFSRALLR